MTWVLAVVVRPLGAIVLFGLALAISFYVLKPLIPNGRVKALLYDRTFRDRRPVVFTMAIAGGYAFIALVGFLVTQ